MIDFRSIQIKRIIAHRINAKTKLGAAYAELQTSLIDATEEVITLLKVRLTDACGRDSHSFISEIDDVSKFFNEAVKMKECTNEDFIEISGWIASKLAECQTGVNMKSGNLLIIDGFLDESNAKHFVIVIKAEYDDVMNSKKGQLEIIRDVFLSKNQKLFKIGILYEYLNSDEGIEKPNDKYATLIFDENIKSNTGPSEYFYKTFLGFRVDRNDKIKTQKFFDSTLTFLKTHIPDTEKRIDIINKFNSFIKNEQPNIIPKEFMEKYLPENLQDKYATSILQNFDRPFSKNTELIKSRLKNRRVTFKGGVYIYVPEAVFEESIKFINTEDALQALKLDDEHSIVQVNGKPYNE